MKKSELKEYIKEEIISVLSEADDQEKASPEDIKTQDELNKSIEKTIELKKKAGLAEDLDDDIEPKLSDINPKDSVAKLASQLADVTKEMKSVVNKWKKSEGKEKDALLKRLKSLTSIKKELEALTISKDDIEDEEM